MSNFRWHLFPDLALRKTGFAFDLLEALYCLESVAAIKALFEIERKQEQLREQLRHTVLQEGSISDWPLESQHVLERIERANSGYQQLFDTLPTEQPATIAGLVAQWNEQAKQGQALYARACATFDEELRQARLKLRQIVSGERFQEAIFLNSPTMYSEGLLPYLQDEDSTIQTYNHRKRVKHRKREQTLMLYLQRFCAKNDTASFFGPINYGRFQPDMDKNIHYTIQDGRYPPKRRVLLSYWAAETLVHAMSRDSRLLVEHKPIRSALIVLKEHTIFLPSLDREVPLDILSLTILRLADAKTSLRTMSQMLEVPLADHLRLVQEEVEALINEE